MARVTGRIASHWRSLGAERGPLGPAISDNTRLAGGEIAFFKYGCLWRRGQSRRVLYGDVDVPLIGKPLLVSPSAPPTILRVFTRRHRVAGLRAQLEPTPAEVAILRLGLEGRLFLKAVGARAAGSNLIPLSITRQSIDGLRVGVRGLSVGRLRDRQLYDVMLRLPDGSIHPLSPHAVYVTRSRWRNFSFLHVTDIHVARRIGSLHARLRRLVRQRKLPSTALAKFENWNDSFSDLIRYANRLHHAGELDFILATGDLVDYLYERGTRNRFAGGNFAFFKSLVMGQGRFSDGRTRREELRVPIFTTLGNHDYRSNPYRLLSRTVLTITDAVKGVLKKVPLVGNILGDILGGLLNAFGIGRVGASKLSFEDERFGDYNLTEREARMLEGGRRPDLSVAVAARMIQIDRDMLRGTAFYFREISRTGSYAVDLGARHRIVMVDTKHDSGFTTDLVDVLLARYIGFGSSERRRFARGFINSEGFSRADTGLVERALNQRSGLVIVGMHAPPICHAGLEFSHFFRETEHRNAAAENTIDFLLRRGGIPPFTPPIRNGRVRVGIGPVAGQTVRIRDIKSDKIRGWRPNGTLFFRKAGSRDDSVAKGVADHADRFLALCAGAGRSGRKVSLVLAGHKHVDVQYRLRRGTRAQLEYYMDYYTENPDRYYHSREFETGDKAVAVRVKPGTRVPGRLGRVRDHTGPQTIEFFRRTLPPFGDPLDRTRDPRRWWRRRSPLILITPALGPIDKNQRREEHPDRPLQPTFQGARLVEVRNDVIRRIRLVPIEEIRERARRPIDKVKPGRPTVVIGLRRS